jgi:hypothetical protein
MFDVILGFKRPYFIETFPCSSDKHTLQIIVTDKQLIFQYLLTPWNIVLLEKIIVSQLVKNFPAFYGTRMFITAFTCASQQYLSWASSVQSMPPHSTSWRSDLNIIFPSTPGSSRFSFPQDSPPDSCIRLSFPPYELHAHLFLSI